MPKYKSIPTQYSGVNFRSKLEATWAAFFDLNKISWKYEPVECDGWIPDFMIKTNSQTYFVEIKPIWLNTIGGVDTKDQIQLPDTFDKCHDATLCLGLGPCGDSTSASGLQSNLIGYQKFICRDVYNTVDKFYPIGFYEPCVFSIVSSFPTAKPICLEGRWTKAQNITQWKSVANKIHERSTFAPPTQRTNLGSF